MILKQPSAVLEPTFLEKQDCVQAVINSNFPIDFKQEIYRFINRNILQDCNRVAPNCLKAHMIKIAQKFKWKKNKIRKLLTLFKSNIGYQGYYLDAGRLRHINKFQNI